MIDPVEDHKRAGLNRDDMYCPSLEDGSFAQVGRILLSPGISYVALSSSADKLLAGAKHYVKWRVHHRVYAHRSTQR